jgi:hypothetical protein
LLLLYSALAETLWLDHTQIAGGVKPAGIPVSATPLTALICLFLPEVL